jgi:hypothetical protein
MMAEAHCCGQEVRQEENQVAETEESRVSLDESLVESRAVVRHENPVLAFHLVESASAAVGNQDVEESLKPVLNI